MCRNILPRLFPLLLLTGLLFTSACSTTGSPGSRLDLLVEGGNTLHQEGYGIEWDESERGGGNSGWHRITY